jgi:hypothetical protein
VASRRSVSQVASVQCHLQEVDVSSALDHTTAEWSFGRKLMTVPVTLVRLPVFQQWALHKRSHKTHFPG